MSNTFFSKFNAFSYQGCLHLKVQFSTTVNCTFSKLIFNVSFLRCTIQADFVVVFSFHHQSQGAQISPGNNLQDDLAKSDLIVGHSFMYCAQAFDDNYYMMDTTGSSSNTKATSSGEACACHQAFWEAALKGRIITKKSWNLANWSCAYNMEDV